MEEEQQQGASEQQQQQLAVPVLLTTPFKQAQLRHRRQGENPHRTDDLDECLDFSRRRLGDDRIYRLTLPDTLETVYRGPIFGIRNVPGFLFAPQALGKDLQTELAYRSVTEYCEGPHRTNLDPSHSNDSIPEPEVSKTMWDLWKDDHRQPEESKKEKKQKTMHSGKPRHRSFQKLSWSTMGFHYDWTERSYNKNLKSDMPCLVKDLSNLFARTSLVADGASNRSFAPTASIVNFYSTKSIMGGHRDDLELALDKPIVSISIGLPAIFLLGGKTKEDEPVLPIVIRSGDVLCMGGNCRLNYHGMARLLPLQVDLALPDDALCPLEHDQVTLATLGVHSSSALSKQDSDCLDRFLVDHRLNINVRQVYPTDSCSNNCPKTYLT
jgi:alkylated DNA repair protein alkB family protein 1